MMLEKFMNRNLIKFIVSSFWARGKKVTSKMQDYEDTERIKNERKMVVSEYIKTWDERPMIRLKTIIDHTWNGNVMKILWWVTISPNLSDEIENVDEDWFLQYMDKIKCVSNSEMQVIWSKVLQRKLEQDDSSNLKLLHILSTMSHEDCEIFQLSLKYILLAWHQGFIYKDDKLLSNEFDLNVIHIAYLRQSGLIDSTDSVKFVTNESYQDVRTILTADGGQIWITEPPPFAIPIYLLSREGLKLYSLLRDSATNIMMDRKYIENLLNHYKGVIVEI